jgi:hypothetical protein
MCRKCQISVGERCVTPEPPRVPGLPPGMLGLPIPLALIPYLSPMRRAQLFAEMPWLKRIDPPPRKQAA